ncbi:unnamed protein product, partial [Meganyctiphanes norvegica]
IIFAALLAIAAAHPQSSEEPIPVAILLEESDPIDGANFRHEFEADSGLSQSLFGSADDNGAQVMSGSYNFPLHDGTIATFNWVADALGFRVEFVHLPVAVAAEHSTPVHAQEQIDFADAQQAAGLVWDQGAEAWI